MTASLLALAVGAGLLYRGGDWLLSGVRSLAVHWKVSALLVSLVVIGFGTSAPELFVSLEAIYDGSPQIALGNVVGSNIANILFVLAIAVIVRPLATAQPAIRQDSMVAFIAAVLLIMVALSGTIGRLEGFFLVCSVLLYLALRLSRDKTQSAAPDHEIVSLRRAALLTVIGFLGLQIGAHLFVDGATGLARQFGLSEAVIGLSIVAIGTSLPELAACIIAARRGQSDIVLGNVLGSNLFNSTIVIGITALNLPIAVSDRFLGLDLWFMLATMIVLLVVIRTRGAISRQEGAFMLAVYAVYVAIILHTGRAHSLISHFI